MSSDHIDVVGFLPLEFSDDASEADVDEGIVFVAETEPFAFLSLSGFGCEKLVLEAGDADVEGLGGGGGVVGGAGTDSGWHVDGWLRNLIKLRWLWIWYRGRDRYQQRR